MLWYCRLGYFNFNKFVNLVRESEKLYRDLIKVVVNRELLCEVCILVKINKRVESNKNLTG